MLEERIKRLAHTIIHYSTKTHAGDMVLIHTKGFETFDLAEAVLREAIATGGIPYLHIEDERATRRLLLEGGEETFKKLGEFLLEQMKRANVYVGIRGGSNVFELADVPKEKLSLYEKYITGPVHIEQRVKHTRWCVMRYPNAAMSQLAQTSSEAFQRFYYDVCCLDYAKMNQSVEPLVDLMNRTDRVRLIAPYTDLQFSIKDIPVRECAGTHNIPDGECFTAPVRDSIEGNIRFNVPSLHEGTLYENIQLAFKNGRAVEMDAGRHTERLRQTLEGDDGASYAGEFSLGFNPYILQPMKDTLFDEKIAGSLHIAMGACYDDASNGNRSALHWDLVQIQRQDYGGGEIYFDDVLIRKDGLFVLPELMGLNPDNLK
ncbi:MAG: aminopeptidase [Candidatus Omnitrophota bacterium]